MNIARGAWLMTPMWLCFAVDVALTLAGQPHAYWDGAYSQAIEGNPLAHPILVCGPWVFAGLAAAWAVILGVLVVCWSHALPRWFAVGETVTHAIGGCTWLVGSGGWGWVVGIGYLAVAAEVSWWCWRRVMRSGLRSG
jgi:hypothetical protein